MFWSCAWYFGKQGKKRSRAGHRCRWRWQWLLSKSIFEFHLCRCHKGHLITWIRHLGTNSYLSASNLHSILVWFWIGKKRFVKDTQLESIKSFPLYDVYCLLIGGKTRLIVSGGLRWSAGLKLPEALNVAWGILGLVGRKDRGWRYNWVDSSHWLCGIQQSNCC